MSVPELWGLRRLVTRNYPILGASATAPVQQVFLDLKDYLQKETVGLLLLRVRGPVVVAGAAPGTANGKENPEALITTILGKTTPSLGIISKNSLGARGIIQSGLFDRAYAIRHADVPDTAGTVQIDFFLPLIFKQPGSINPIEWSLPLSVFENYVLQLNCGGRDQLYTGGTNTWDLSGLRIEVWADIDDGVAGQFHIVEEVEQAFPVVASQSDFQIFLEKGYIYTHIMFMAERDNVLVDDIINNIVVQSAGRVWTPQGDANASAIQRWNRERFINSAAEALTGTYFIPALRDGMYKRAIDALDARVEIKLDVTLGAGTTRTVTVKYRRIIPLGLNVAAARAA